MYEWLAITLAGAAGGLLGTLLPAGLDVPFAARIAGALHGRGSLEVAAHLARNVACGAAVSFLLWAGIDGDGASWTGAHPGVRPVAVSLLVGLTGTATLNKVVRDAQLQKDVRDALAALLAHRGNPPPRQEGQ
ncbi:MAG: hypothetical protein ACR2HN_06775 [Tepidiformaceae bacterium]